MKNILTAPFIQEISELTANMYRLGWDERNGGNISWLLEDEPLEYYLDLDHVIRTIPINFDASYVNRNRKIFQKYYSKPGREPWYRTCGTGWKKPGVVMGI